MIHICIGNITIIGLDNGLLPGRHQAIIWINVVFKMVAILSQPQYVNPSKWSDAYMPL